MGNIVITKENNILINRFISKKVVELSTEELETFCKKLLTYCYIYLGHSKTDDYNTLITILSNVLKTDFQKVALEEVRVAVKQGIKLEYFKHVSIKNITYSINQYLDNPERKHALRMYIDSLNTAKLMQPKELTSEQIEQLERELFDRAVKQVKEFGMCDDLNNNVYRHLTRNGVKFTKEQQISALKRAEIYIIKEKTKQLDHAKAIGSLLEMRKIQNELRTQNERDEAYRYIIAKKILVSDYINENIIGKQ